MILKNCSLAVLSSSKVINVDVRIENGKITEQKKQITPRRGEEIIDLTGKIVMPGFVNAHTHLYSSLARGMSAPKIPPKNFLEILLKIWWKLDRALDEESIYYSAFVGAIEAALCGTTTLIDHHASPKAIDGSLDIIKQAMNEVGLRGVLCYEVTDRGGMNERNKGLLENERFIQANKTNQQFRGMVGAHASFTLGNESLRLLGEMAERNQTGVHIHAAEDKCDIVDAEENYRQSVAERLKQWNILKKESILAHCIHHSHKDFQTIHQHNCWLVHNPRSNMNNAVGYAPVHLFGERVALGTDGFPGDMFEEARTAFFKSKDMRYESWDMNRKTHSPFTTHQSPDFSKLATGGQTLISEIFQQKFGTLNAGSVADLLVLDYQSPTPVTKENLAGHFLFGMRSANVESVMVGGKWIVWNRQFPGIEVESIMNKARKSAKKLWERLRKL
ncbi:MAG: putative aminohydrolase SsnA [Ignavibacteriae bacterium]|nr:putative aminohydrolase SsnA [Ignavibacteriota bacterium]